MDHPNGLACAVVRKLRKQFFPAAKGHILAPLAEWRRERNF
jgi:hypothetical protein